MLHNLYNKTNRSNILFLGSQYEKKSKKEKKIIHCSESEHEVLKSEILIMFTFHFGNSSKQMIWRTRKNVTNSIHRLNYKNKA